ncbi:hypothetical protein OV203_32660 [Nannocystis sp. ILAH1]|uniref:hypothetical protein n=1 Tax=Nannocystis sp. ILAH1 TaxID=2996789 RepID=UPI00227140A5|nr:hypothetical protein [Nannocystis sp. ILAH1]MCY0991935.1 hypothetical protein [Nannocystis sp. ILAH1]
MVREPPAQAKQARERAERAGEGMSWPEGQVTGLASRLQGARAETNGAGDDADPAAARAISAPTD